MVLTRSGDNHKVSSDQVKHQHDQNTRKSMSRRSQDLQRSSTGDRHAEDVEFLSLKRKRTRSTSKNELSICNVQNGNSEDEFISRKFNSGASAHSSASNNLKYALRHSSVDADISIMKKREGMSHSRSLRSLGLEEEGSSCEEDDGIGALATSCRPRSSSRETFPNMLLRRSSRQKKTMYSTLNMSTLEHAVIMNEELDHDAPRQRKKARSIKPELRDLLIAQGKDPDELESLSQPDIYSSIKSRKRMRRPRRFFDEDDPVLPLPGLNHMESDHSDQEQEEEEKDENNVENAEDGEEEDVELEQDTGRKYSLRTKRAQPLRLVYEIQRQTRPTPRGMFDHMPPSPAHRRRSKLTTNPASPYQHRQRRTNSQGASSTSSSDSDIDERKFQKRKKKSMTKARNRCLPMNLTMNDLASHGFAGDRRKIGSSLADVDPMNVDKTVKFSSIGGHRKHVQSLKEMVVFPLLYPEVFQKFQINPPRGCLFYGPPGNGKTLMARALANECSTDGRKVAFFMRKGADCLSKWVGESERQLRLLFDQAYQMRPSIIFFDEIDGLAPVRSSRQDQIHSSIVSTLLGLMDGLDNRGEIIVIGATNRIDSIDPALRRPGRFDREFAFPPPNKETRYEILKIHTQKWSPPLSEPFLDDLAERTTGYCGADIMTLCAESTLFALRRRYPQIYASDQKLKLNVDAINIQASDFYKAMKVIVPSSQRSNPSPAYALHSVVRPLFIRSLKSIMELLADQCPLMRKKSKILRSSLSLMSFGAREGQTDANEESESDSEDATNATIPLPVNGLTIPQSLLSVSHSNTYRESTVHRPRLLICGEKVGGITTHLAPSLLYDLEGMPVHLLDIPALYGTSVRTPEEACAQIFREARRTAPSIIYMPNAPMWWDCAAPTVRYTFNTLLKSLPASSPVMLIATAECFSEDLSDDLADMFSVDTEIFTMELPTYDERLAFFAPVFLQLAKKAPANKHRKSIETMEVLEKAPPPIVAKLTQQELDKIELTEESTMRSLRLFLRDVLTRLAQDRRFKAFLKPVDTEEVPDYVEVIANPMDISTMMNKIDQHQYNNVATFVEDINLICSNALEYNPDHCAEDRAIRHRACLLKDIALAIIEDDLDLEFEKRCNEVIEARKRRKANPLKFAPKYYKVLPKPSQSHLSPSTPNNEEESTMDSCIASKPHSVPIKSPSTSTRKRRRRSAWASGKIKKPKKIERKNKVKEEEASTNDEDDENEEKDDQKEEDNDQKEEDNDQKEVEGDQKEKVDDPKEVEDDNKMEEKEDGDETSEETTQESVLNLDADAATADSILTERNTTLISDNDHQSQTDLFESVDMEADERNQSRDTSCSSFPDSAELVDSPIATESMDSASIATQSMDFTSIATQSTDKLSTEEICTSSTTKQADTSQNSFEIVEKDQTLVTSTPQEEEDLTDILEDLEDDVMINDRTATLNRSKEIEDDNVEEDLPSASSLRVTRMTLRSRGRSHKDDETVAPPSLPPPPPLIVDDEELKDILCYSAKATADFFVERLERLYSILVRCVYKHRHNYDKTMLTQELEDEVFQCTGIRRSPKESVEI